MTKAQALLHALLDSILRHTPESRAVYGQRARLVAGDRLVAPELALTLEALAVEGPDALYRGELGAAIATHVQEHGGAITRRDLETYRVIRRRPVEVAYRGHTFESNPPPSSGGALIAYGLALLDRAGPSCAAGSAPELVRMLEVLREQTRARDERFTRELYRGGLARRLLSESSLSAAARRLRSAPKTESASGRDDAHLGHGRRGKRGVAVLVDGRRLGRRRPRHWHPHEQHARRVRPSARRARSEAGHAADEHDVALRVVERRRAPSRAG